VLLKITTVTELAHTVQQSGMHTVGQFSYTVTSQLAVPKRGTSINLLASEFYI